MPLEGRSCRKCGEYRPRAEYGVHPNCAGGMRSTCKTCRRSEYHRLPDEKKREIWSRMAVWGRENPERRLRTHRVSTAKRSGTWAAGEYEKAEAARPHVTQCECCGTSRPNSKQTWCADHDHVSGLFRGFLCDSCNVGIGRLGDSIDGVLNALEYLSKRAR